MRFFSSTAAIAALLFTASINAQQQTTTVPQLIRFNGTYRAASPSTQTGGTVATFAIYQDESALTPLWSEIQTIQPDKDGSYTVLLGSTQSQGIPVSVFSSSDSRWLEVEVNQEKQPRILLVSVPYALKASDADTLGGLPASAYLRAASPGVVTGTASGTTAGVTALTENPAEAKLAPRISSGTPNCIGMFSNTTDLVCSTIYQGTYQSNPAVSIGGGSLLGALTLIGNVPSGDAAGMALYNSGGGGGSSVSLDMYNTFANGGIPQAKIKAVDDGDYSDNLTFWTKVPGGPNNPVTEKVRITSTGDVGVGTATPSQKLEVNGNVMVDGNINLSGTIQSTGTAGPIFQAPNNGSYNFAAGIGALPNTTPTLGTTNNFLNTAIGNQALNQNTTGSGNTAVGFAALQTSTSGSNNVAIGTETLRYNTTGSDNAAIGVTAMAVNTTGSWNVGLGYSALNQNTTGSQNVAIGEEALSNNQTGSSNAAIGSGALVNRFGDNNIGIGTNAGASGAPASGSNNIYIGSGTVVSGSNENGVIRIGIPINGIATATFIAGIRGITTGNNDAIPVYIDSNGQLGTVSSSRRFKKDITDMGGATTKLMQLRPVTYRYKQPFADGSEPIQYGLIAEEVAEVYPDLVAHSADGQIETVKYQVLDSMLLNEVQKLHHENAAQKDKIKDLEDRLSRLESAIERNGMPAASK